MTYALALSDDLLKCYMDFCHGEAVDSRMLQKLLNYYHAPHITTVEQLKRINYVDDTSLLSQLASSGFLSLTDIDILKRTTYKIILNTIESNYPYVNINNDSVKKSFSMTFKVHENRKKSIDLITALCADANSILIHDNYFTNKNNWGEAKKIFIDVLPKKSLNILCEKFQNNDIITELTNMCSDWSMSSTVTKSGYAHDRYLLIDNKIEVILSSGFYYLFNTSKEITVLICEVGVENK